MDDRLGEHYAKSSKSERKTHTVCCHLYVEPKKHKLVNTTEKTHRYRELVVTRRAMERRRGNLRVEDLEVNYYV